MARKTRSAKMSCAGPGMPIGMANGVVQRSCWMLISKKFIYFYLFNSFYIISWRCSKDGNGSDFLESDSDSSFYHILNHMDTDSDIFGYECKMDASDSDSNSNIHLIYELTFRYFLY